MKIYNTKTPVLSELNKPEKTVKKEPSASVSSPKDVVEISSRAVEMRGAIEAARSAPDIRTEKVQVLKEEIGRGMYKVRAGSVADKMLESVFEKKQGNLPD